MKVKFKEWNCIAVKAEYMNGRAALELVEDGTGESILMATVNVPEIHLLEGEVLIKDYSENKGVLLALQNAGVIGEALQEIPLNFVTIQRCKLLI